MSFDLSSITKEKRIKAPRIILLGVEKIGKSTFASQSDNPIFLSIKGEEGIDGIEVDRFPIIENKNDLIGCLKTLCSEEHDYHTVVIDSASSLEPIIWNDVCEKNENVDSIEKVGGGYAKGYTEALYQWRQVSEILDYLRNEKNMASIIIGHVKIKIFNDPIATSSYDQYQFDINDRAANLLYRWADCILFCNTKVIVKKEDKGFGKEVGRGREIREGARFLYTQKRPGHPGGGRGAYGHLPYELSLDWNSFQNAVSGVMNV